MLVGQGIWDGRGEDLGANGLELKAGVFGFAGAEAVAVSVSGIGVSALGYCSCWEGRHDVPNHAVAFLDTCDIGPDFKHFAGDVGAEYVGVVLDVESLEEVSGAVAKCCAAQSLVPVS